MRKFFKFIFKTALVIAILTLAIAMAFGNFNGYCKQERRILAEKELLQKAAGRIYKDNPYCCIFSKEAWFPDSDGNFINKLFGRYIHQVDVYYKRDIPLFSDFKEPYYEKHFIINQCGDVIDIYGDYITEKEYLTTIKMIKRIGVNK